MNYIKNNCDVRIPGCPVSPTVLWDQCCLLLCGHHLWGNEDRDDDNGDGSECCSDEEKDKTKIMVQTIITMHRTQRLILTHMFATSSWPSLKSSSLQSQCSSLTGSPHLFLLAKTHFANSGLDGEFFWLLQSWSCAHASLPLVFTSTSSQRLRSKSHANIFICGIFAF